jgi:hypothetical protein
VFANLRLLLTCHGGKKKGGGEAIPRHLHRLLPERCYGVSTQELPRANHVVPYNGTAIFCRTSGPSSTSKMEVPRCSVRRSSSSLHRQVVRPRRRRSGHRIINVAGSMLSSVLASHLDGNVSRSPATGGGDVQGPNCFFSFCLRVFYAILEGLSSNSGLSVQKMLEDLFVNLYPPCVMQ